LLDGPILHKCYCPACSKEFKAVYGKPITETSYGEHLSSNVDGITDFMKEIYGIVKSVNPELMLYINNSALRADVTGSNTRKVEPYVDTVIFIAGDYKPRSFYMHTYHETKLYYAQSLANGANVWYGIQGPFDQMNTEGGKAAIEMNAFINKHKDICAGSKEHS
jgi:hypothetical protein